MSGQPLKKTDGVETESARLAALDRYDILDTSREIAFDRIAELIRLTLGVEASIVSLMDAHRQWYKAVEGFPTTEAPLQNTFCKHLLYAGDAVVVVPDATKDDRFSSNPFVAGDPHVKFYAGAPIRTSDGHNIGSVCAIDYAPRVLTEREQSILGILAQMAMNEIELRQRVSVDMLTGVSTRAAFKEDAQKLVALARRHKAALSCIALDIDHFKSVNDSYGHDVGDEVLVSIARTAAQTLRESDLLGRLGGEEFAILLPHTSAMQACEVAEKLRRRFEGLKFKHCTPPLSTRASFGVADFDLDHDDLDSLLQKADEALYESKRSGRNKWTAWQLSESAVQASRRRVLKAGQLIFNGRFSVIDCTIKALWDGGAELQVSSSAGIPGEFILAMKSERIEHACRVSERRDQRLVVRFS